MCVRGAGLLRLVHTPANFRAADMVEVVKGGVLQAHSRRTEYTGCAPLAVLAGAHRGGAG